MDGFLYGHRTIRPFRGFNPIERQAEATFCNYEQRKLGDKTSDLLCSSARNKKFQTLNINFCITVTSTVSSVVDHPSTEIISRYVSSVSDHTILYLSRN